MRRSQLLWLCLVTCSCSTEDAEPESKPDSTETGSESTTEPSDGDSTSQPTSSSAPTSSTPPSPSDTTEPNGEGGTVDPGTDPTDDPPAEGPTRGAISVHVSPNGTCALGDRWVDLPQVEGARPVTATAHADLLEDGTRDDNGWAVDAECEWLEVQAPYAVSLNLSLTSDDDRRYVTLSPVVDPGTTTSSTLLVRDGEALPRLDAAGDLACDVETLELDFEGGVVWVEFSCAKLTSLTDATQDCQVVEGYAYFENCVARQ